MFVKERQDLILEELNAQGSVRVKELSERFGVSEDLIRKDLNVLEKQDKCKKIYGGAILVRENVYRKTASQRKMVNADQKKKIAQKAIELIEDGSVVFLDISTTIVELARLIVEQNKPITVVTNSLEVIRLLVDSNVNAIFIGGELDYGKDGFVGSLADQMLSNFYFDLAFLGVVAIDCQQNALYTYMANDGVTKHVVLSRSKKSYIVCDHEKFSQIGNYKYASLDEIDGIVTDSKLSPIDAKEIQKMNIDILL